MGRIPSLLSVVFNDSDLGWFKFWIVDLSISTEQIHMFPKWGASVLRT